MKLEDHLFFINIPLTFAPLSLLSSFKKLTQLNPMVLLSYLNKSPKCLVKEQATAHNVASMVLNFKQMQTILEYILAEDSSLQTSCTIPLRIDLNSNLGCFDRNKPSYLSDYSSLLPLCGQDFLSLEYANSVIYSLCRLGFVKGLEPDYLAKHLNVESFQSSSSYSLFWEFVLENKMTREDLSKFNKHFLVPVVFERIHGVSENKYYSIAQLKFVMTSSLQTSDEALFNLLNKLGCPRLNLGPLTNPTQYRISPDSFITELNAFVNAIAISDIRAPDIILGSIQCSSDLPSAILDPIESTKLLDICSQLKPSTLSQDQIRTLSSLKMFESLSSQCFSLEQCQICFVGECGIPLCSTLLDILREKHQLVVFKKIQEKFLEALCQVLNKQLINITALFSDYIFLYLPTIPFADQKEIIRFLAGKFAEEKHDFIPHLIEILTDIPFIKITNERFCRINELYSTGIRFISEFLPRRSLPKDWSDENLKPLFLKLGLQKSVSLDDILLVAIEFSMRRFECDKLNILLKELEIILQTIDWDKLAQKEIQTLEQLRNLQFLPVLKMNNITQHKFSNKLAMFSEAQLREYRNCCCTSAWIHKFSFKFHPLSYEILKINEEPEPKLVVDHLKTIISQILQQNCHTNIPAEYEKYFNSCYSFFERLKEPSAISLRLFYDFRCIIWKEQLYYPVNMLFTTIEELNPFIIQLPPEMASEYPTFLKSIGVAETANHTHFSYVIAEIHNKLLETTQKLIDSGYEKQTKTVFNLLIRNLRKLESNTGIISDIELTRILLLTRDSQLLPSKEVVYADNQSLLSRVIKVKIDINILIPLEPDDNKSCVPPSCLKLEKLSDIIGEEIDPDVLKSMLIKIITRFADFLTVRLKEPIIYQAMHRLYFHLTKNDLDNLVFINGQFLLVTNGSPPPDSLTVLQLLNRLEVISVQQIDLSLKDRRSPTRKYTLQNVSGCYLRDHSFLVSDHHTKHEFLIKDIAYSLNSYFGDIFTEVLHCLEVCVQIQDSRGIMAKLDEYNILRDDTCPMPTEVRDSIPDRNTHSGYYTPFSNAPRQPPRPEGISLGEPDHSAARLSLIVSQCELLAARHLITPIPPRNHVFPPLACFLCFEALINAFQAFLHFIGSVNRLTKERNLRVFLSFLGQILLPNNEQIFRRIEVLTCPLMNYGIDTRYPPASLIPFLGCYVPQQLYTVDQAKEAIENVKEIFDLLARAMYPDQIILSETDPMLSCCAPSNPQLIETILQCKF